MLYIEYTSQGKPVSDFELENQVNYVMELSQKLFPSMLRYSTSNIFDMIMLKVAQRDIDANKIMFLYNDIEIKINQDSTIDNWPNGFLLDIAKIMEDTIKASFAQRHT